MDRVVTALPLDSAAAPDFFRLASHGENVLECSLGALVLEPFVEHQPADDPASEAERVKSPGRVGAESFGVRQRVIRCEPRG